MFEDRLLSAMHAPKIIFRATAVAAAVSSKKGANCGRMGMDPLVCAGWTIHTTAAAVLTDWGVKKREENNRTKTTGQHKQ